MVYQDVPITEIYTAEGKKLRDIAVSVFKNNKEKLMPESLHL